jgi:hypothetical protein
LECPIVKMEPRPKLLQLPLTDCWLCADS